MACACCCWYCCAGDIIVALDGEGESNWGGVPPVVFARLRGAEEVPCELSVTVGGA